MKPHAEAEIAEKKGVHNKEWVKEIEAWIE